MAVVIYTLLFQVYILIEQRSCWRFGAFWRSVATEECCQNRLFVTVYSLVTQCQCFHLQAKFFVCLFQAYLLFARWTVLAGETPRTPYERKQLVVQRQVLWFAVLLSLSWNLHLHPLYPTGGFLENKETPFSQTVPFPIWRAVQSSVSGRELFSVIPSVFIVSGILFTLLLIRYS